MGNCIIIHRLKRLENIPHAFDPNKIPANDVCILPRGSSGSDVALMPTQCSHPLPEPSAGSGERYRSESLSSITESQILASPGLKSFLFSELQEATGNFFYENILGEGGFGCVFKGWLDKDTLTATKPDRGMAVAVKRLKPHGFQGHKEWLSEVNHLGRLHHPNLVKLIGFCLEGEHRLLVYEYMHEGSLENHLFKKNCNISWETRVKIAIGAAKGLNFLHNSEPQVIYRDFKASNILLDSDFNAKLSDFGLAKRGPIGDQTHVTTLIMGTEGYAAPEYIQTGKLNAKCDIFSFGVVLYELITGRIAIDLRREKSERNLMNWVKTHMQDKRSFLKIMDSRLEGRFPRRGAFVAATLALHCTNPQAKYRPPMSEVIEYLEKLNSPKFLMTNLQLVPPPSPQPGLPLNIPFGSPSSSAPRSPTHLSPGNWSPINRSPRSPRHVAMKSPHHSRFSGYIEPR